MTTTTRNALRCTYSRDGHVCGKAREDETVHVWLDERMQRGKHVWRHDVKAEHLLETLREDGWVEGSLARGQLDDLLAAERLATCERIRLEIVGRTWPDGEYEETTLDRLLAILDEEAQR